MPQNPRNLDDHQCYHITTRGNRKKTVFFEDDDYYAFIKILRKSKDKHRAIHLYAYCLMPNHVHLLINSSNAAEIPKFMHRTNRIYAVYLNNKYSYVGHVWQKRYSAKPILHTRYLQNCVDYIENNPVRANICTRKEDYPWSSYRDHLSPSSTSMLDSFCDYF